MATCNAILLTAVLFFNAGLPMLGTQNTSPEKPIQGSQLAIVPLPIVPGGASRVWLDTTRNRYSCSYERQYGKSKRGEYMTERQAKERGARPQNKSRCPSR